MGEGVTVVQHHPVALLPFVPADDVGLDLDAARGDPPDGGRVAADHRLQRARQVPEQVRGADQGVLGDLGQAGPEAPRSRISMRRRDDQALPMSPASTASARAQCRTLGQGSRSGPWVVVMARHRSLLTSSRPGAGFDIVQGERGLGCAEGTADQCLVEGVRAAAVVSVAEARAGPGLERQRVPLIWPAVVGVRPSRARRCHGPRR